VPCGNELMCISRFLDLRNDLNAAFSSWFKEPTLCPHRNVRRRPSLNIRLLKHELHMPLEQRWLHTQYETKVLIDTFVLFDRL
jgi:hypothetical protein